MCIHFYGVILKRIQQTNKILVNNKKNNNNNDIDKCQCIFFLLCNCHQTSGITGTIFIDLFFTIVFFGFVFFVPSFFVFLTRYFRNKLMPSS